MLSRYCIVTLLTLVPALIATAENDGSDASPLVDLGERLFFDDRFSSPAGDLDTGCASCHMPADPLGNRAFTELLALSWHPFRDEDPIRETLRNTPTLVNLDGHALIHFDGEFESIEELTHTTFVGRNFGWLPNEREEALAQFTAIVRESESPYAEEFKTALNIEVQRASSEQILDGAAKAVAAYVLTLRSEFTSPYDRFVEANELPKGPEPRETPAHYADRVIETLLNRSAVNELAYVDGFGPDELEGYKMFLETNDPERAGNCVACHVPPSFTDANFHNVGVTQDVYDTLHGSGAFAKLDIPARREAANRNGHLRETRDHPERADLGYWNFARFENSPMRLPSEDEAAFHARTVAAFKTPTLRHLAATDPYMHNGAYKTVESVLDLKMRAAFWARLGQLRNPAPELHKLRLIEDDARLLYSFLNALHDEGERKLPPPKEPEPIAVYVSVSSDDADLYAAPSDQ